MSTLSEAISKAVREGALWAYDAELDPDQQPSRQIYMRPDVAAFVNGRRMHPEQRAVLQAAFDRFVEGGRVVVIREGSSRSVLPAGDLKELRGGPPPFFEFRFRPPPRQARFFGRFVATDILVLTGCGEKVPGGKSLDVGQMRKRCDDQLLACGIATGPRTVEACITNARMVWE